MWFIFSFVISRNIWSNLSSRSSCTCHVQYTLFSVSIHFVCISLIAQSHPSHGMASAACAGWPHFGGAGRSHQEKVGSVFLSFAKKILSLELWKDTKDAKDVFFQRHPMSLISSVPFLSTAQCVFDVFGKNRLSLERTDRLWKEPTVFGKSRLSLECTNCLSTAPLHLV